MTRFSTADLEALVAEWEGVTLTPGVETSPAFDDDPDQRDVSFPVIRVEGVEGWSSIGVPERLVGLSAMPGLVADYHLVRTGVEKLISQLAQHAAAALDGRALDIATELDRILNGDTNE